MFANACRSCSSQEPKPKLLSNQYSSRCAFDSSKERKKTLHRNIRNYHLWDNRKGVRRNEQIRHAPYCTIRSFWCTLPMSCQDFSSTFTDWRLHLANEARSYRRIAQAARCVWGASSQAGHPHPSKKLSSLITQLKEDIFIINKTWKELHASVALKTAFQWFQAFRSQAVYVNREQYTVYTCVYILSLYSILYLYTILQHEHKLKCHKSIDRAYRERSASPDLHPVLVHFSPEQKTRRQIRNALHLSSSFTTKAIPPHTTLSHGSAFYTTGSSATNHGGKPWFCILVLTSEAIPRNLQLGRWDQETMKSKRTTGECSKTVETLRR